jgi:tetratricopeptide (TPR) repeat protein
MTLARPNLFKLLAVAATFLAALGAFSLITRSGDGAARSGPAVSDADLPRPGASTDERIRGYQAAVRAQPGDAGLRAALGAAYLQKVRETGDPGFYARADAVLARARALAPGDYRVLAASGTLALARHDFAGGLAYGLAARRANPASDAPYPVIVDGLVELGRYAEAGRELQRFVDAKPTLASYSRVSYFRELHGDLEGAAQAMALALSAGGDAAENAAYVQTLLGTLEFDRGRLGSARDAFRLALVRFPGYVPASAGLARVEAAEGRTGAAVRRYRDVVARLPLPEYVVALGETELAAGRAAQGRRDLGLVGAEERLLQANGVNTDVDLALFEANHGSAVRAVALARRAWATAPSVRSADALGWALTAAGRPRDGLAWGRRALGLGSRDAGLNYHAGMSARAAGDRAAARRYLHVALADNPRFSPLYAPRARRALEALS